MAGSYRSGNAAAFPAVAGFLEMSRHSADDDAAPLRGALYLAEDLAALGSKPDGFDFQGFADLVERARGVLRQAKGREVQE